MTKKIAALTILIAFSYAVSGQNAEKPKRIGRPNIPGTFVLELGINGLVNAPSNFDIGFWGSRTLNFYYQYDVRIANSKFSVVPGIGLSMERYKFKDLHTLGYDEDDSLKLFTPTESGFADIRKSQLITNYVDIPIEIKFLTNPNDPARSFKASIGGRIGYLYGSSNKIKYKEDDELKKLKDKQNFNLNKIRYGVFTKIGVGNFSVFGYYNLTNLFEDGKGPGQAGVVTDFPTFTVGISLSAF